MDTNAMFEKASRLKLRFVFRGSISVEDLWDLPIQSKDPNALDLDTIFKALNAKMKLAAEESLIDAPSKAEEELALRLEIVRYIAKVKQEEADARVKLAELKARKQFLLGVKAEKENAELQGKSLDEINKMIADMG